jgi:hypothetical protein
MTDLPDEIIGENNLYVFYENNITSKMTRQFLKKYKNIYREWSLLKKYNIRNSKGAYIIQYPLTPDKVNEYLENS